MDNKVPISILIMTKNEEKNIRQCLESVKWADEIFIVDSQSEDRTLDIAGEYTDKIYQFEWNGKFPKKKNWSIKNMSFSHEWVLMLDADEIVPESLGAEIRSILENDQGCSGFVARFNYYFLGKLIRYGDPVRKVVFFKHKKASYEELDDSALEDRADVEVHEHQIINGKVGFLKTRITHNDQRDLYYYFNRHNRYSSWEAYLLETHRYDRGAGKNINGKSFRDWLSLRRTLKRFFYRLPCKPLIYFFYTYILRFGFLDGYPGFAYNVCKAIYIYEIELKRYEIRRRARESV
ncbi:MAG: glycosyltransferase [Candidatus Omnitrophica bacterium]|nr:glycosyltransferase [Candidatus Omnitrophota bacterium]